LELSPAVRFWNTSAMQVPLLDLKAQYRAIKAEVDQAVAEVFESQHFILGPKVQACEEKLALYCRCPHAIGVSSGSDALLIALMAEGIGPGDEVITSPHSFFATAGCVARLGAKPVFVDADPATYNLRPDLIEAAVTPRTRAIIPVHLFGQMADMDPILEIAARRNLIVIEDAAQAIGSEYKGRRAGSLGHYGCFSFFPSKNLGCAGDGGLVTSADAGRAEKLRVLRAHGSKPKYFHKVIGGNFRLDALQAAVVLAKLPYLDGWTAGRQTNAARYNELFRQSGLVERGRVSCPVEAPQRRHIYNQYVLRVECRDALQKHLTQAGIGSEVYYPVPFHLQECFAYLGGKRGDFPASEAAADNTLAIPVYPELSTAQQHYVVSTIAAFYR
jgi:dTDP-4-amino-4,6-dideoxygalactose transaminase